MKKETDNKMISDIDLKQVNVIEYWWRTTLESTGALEHIFYLRK